MKKLTLLLTAISMASGALCQLDFQRQYDVEVQRITDSLDLAWSGGLNYVQLSNIDLNFDGRNDLFLFDRTGDKFFTFIHNGSSGQRQFTYTDEYDTIFPQMHNWALLRDYNCDGKPDIFTYVSAGIRVYKNVGDGSTFHQFEEEVYRLDTWTFSGLTGGYSNLYSPLGDIPGIEDIDNDGDLDVLTFGVLGRNMEYHRNLSMETYGHCDSLMFAQRNQCWGLFSEAATTNGVSLYDTLLAPCDSTNGGTLFTPERGQDRHSGSSILAIDLDSSGVMDLVLGDVSYPNLVRLLNEGDSTNSNSGMFDQDTLFPVYDVPVSLNVFPAGYYVDIDADDTREFVAAVNAPVGAVDQHSIWAYENVRNDAYPEFSFIQPHFLQDQMIDVGTGSRPRFFDHNGDGLLDLIIANQEVLDQGAATSVSRISLYENQGTATNPNFVFITDDYQNLSTLGLGLHITPDFGDMDCDGDEDMFIGVQNGYVHYFENTAGAGNVASFALVEADIQDNMGNPVNQGSHAIPTLVDLDNDGKLDIVLATRLGNLTYYRNIGINCTWRFQLEIPNLGGVDVSEYTTPNGYGYPAFVKVNNDFRLIEGSDQGWLYYYDNISGNIYGQFNLVDSIYLGIDMGRRSAPAIADLDADGRVEMVVGLQNGGLALYRENTPSMGLDEWKAIEFSIVPNPTQGSVTLTLPGDITRGSYRVMDISGRVLSSALFYRNEFDLDLGKFSTGSYLIQVLNESMEVLGTEHVVKE